MQKPDHHIFLCCSFRNSGDAQGACAKKDAAQFAPYLEGELADRGMNGFMVSKCGCLKVCERGPAMLVYPEGYWVGGLSQNRIDQTLDALQEGKIPEGLLC